MVDINFVYASFLVWSSLPCGSIAMAHCRILALLHLSSWLSLLFSLLWDQSAAIIQTRDRVNPYCLLLCFWNQSWKVKVERFSHSALIIFTSKKANLIITRYKNHVTAHIAYHFRSICQCCSIFGQFTQLNWSLNVPRVVCCSTSFFSRVAELMYVPFQSRVSSWSIGSIIFLLDNVSS